MIEIKTDYEFEKLKKEQKIVLVDVYANWCGPCKKLGPILEEISQKFKDKILFYKMNADQFPEEVEILGIKSLPYVFIMKNGVVIGSFSGLQTESFISKFISKHL